MKERRNSSALAVELRLSCTKPSRWSWDLNVLQDRDFTRSYRKCLSLLTSLWPTDTIWCHRTWSVLVQIIVEQMLTNYQWGLVATSYCRGNCYRYLNCRVTWMSCGVCHPTPTSTSSWPVVTTRCSTCGTPSHTAPSGAWTCRSVASVAVISGGTTLLTEMMSWHWNTFCITGP